MNQLDDHAARLLHLVVLPIVDMVHDGEIFDADLWLQRYDPPTLRQIAVLLAGLSGAAPMRQAVAVEALIQERFAPSGRRPT